MKKEKIYVTKTFMPPFEEYVEEIRDLWDSSWITNMGAKHVELEEALKSVLGVPAVSLSCRTDTWRLSFALLPCILKERS